MDNLVYWIVLPPTVILLWLLVVLLGITLIDTIHDIKKRRQRYDV